MLSDFQLKVLNQVVDEIKQKRNWRVQQVGERKSDFFARILNKNKKTILKGK
jgi:hypothetical protein